MRWKRKKKLDLTVSEEIKKSKTQSGDGVDDMYVSKWFEFQRLMFLKEEQAARPTLEGGIIKVSK